MSRGDTGILQADLLCPETGPAIRVSGGARLQMNGHSISGGSNGISTSPGIHTTKIEGPGEIFGVTAGGSDPVGCAITSENTTVVRDVSIHDNRCGIFGIYNHRITLRGVTITNSVADAVVNLAGSPGNGGVFARDVTIADNGGYAIESYGRVKLQNATVTSNAAGGLSLPDPRVDPSGGPEPPRAKLFDSTLTGNGPGGDVAAVTVPVLIDTTCEHSVDLVSAGTLGICSVLATSLDRCVIIEESGRHTRSHGVSNIRTEITRSP